MSGRRLGTVVLAIAFAVAGCAIAPEAVPHDVPAERSGIFGEPATGDEAAGTGRIFLASSDPDQPAYVRSVLRDVPAAPQAVLGSLFAGPNASEREAQLDTAIPADVELLSARTVGQQLTVDMNDVFGQLDPVGLRLAVTQIVATATELDGIETVQLRVDGAPRVWPIGNGELTDRPLSRYDFPGLIASSQPAFPAIPSRTT